MHVQGTSEAIASATVRTKPFRVSEVADMLDVHPVTIYRDIEAGRLRALRVGSKKGALRILPADLDAYVALLEVRSASVASDGMTVDTAHGAVDLVAIEQATSGHPLELTVAEAAFLGMLKARITSGVAA